MSQYFLGITNPDMLRKDLLEAAKLSVTVLKSQYRLKELRANKIDKLQKLRDVMNDIGTMMDKLENSLPEHNPEDLPEAAKRAMEKAKEENKIDDLLLEEEEPKTPQKKQKQPEPIDESEPDIDIESDDEPAIPPEKSAEELNKLEEKLSLIESKLNKL